MDHTTAVMPKITAPNTAVFAFQFEGWAYQPPDGDQTCFGYLRPLLELGSGGEAVDEMSGLTESCRPPTFQLASVSLYIREGIGYHLA
jgi:hypothetical protein